MPTLRDITTRLQQDARNKIVFCRDYFDGIQFVDVGLELSRILGEKPDEVDGADTAYKQVLGQCWHHEDLGVYLAIENIGILFEPELKLDVRSIIDAYSKNQCLIVKTEAEIEDGKLYFLCKGDGVVVNLQGFAYIVLET